jgi:hypothetical protein
MSLTSRIFYRTFHTIYEDGKHFSIKTCPFNLAVQESVGGMYILNWFWEDWFLRDSRDIAWMPTLGELLWGEKIWGDLFYCCECLKYKPDTAFDGFDFERKVLEKHRARIARMEREDVEGYWDLCRRCRAKLLFKYLERREVVYEDGNDWENRKTLGLKRLKEANTGASGTTWAEWHAIDHNYERWEDVFAKLDI